MNMLKDWSRRLFQTIARLSRFAPRPSAQSKAAEVRVAAEVDAKSADVRVALWVHGIYYVLIAMMGILLYVVYTLLILWISNANGGECAEDCGPNAVCRHGECISVELACDVGDPCGPGICACKYPARCAEGVCEQPAPPSPCPSGSEALVAEIQKFHAKCRARVGKSLSEGCPPAQIAEFMLEHEKFDELLQQFQHGVIFLFPSKQPKEPPPKGNWPSETGRRSYLDAVHANRELLGSAAHLVFIGRADGGSSTGNYVVAQNRISFAMDRVLDVVATDQNDRERRKATYIDFVLGGDRPLKLEFFDKYSQPLAMWDPREHQEFSALKQARESGHPIQKRRLDAVVDMINRSVVVIAIPEECTVRR